MQVTFFVYAELESLLEKMSTCHNNPKKSSTTKISKRTPSGYSLFAHCSFDITTTTKNSIILSGFKRTCNKNNRL